ncbi:hypothetical protein C5B85_16460 [Pseudoclavibacter sp. AY1F1]|uniref:hypothetical protein n=1 Tax=Pseudoclavibacter sp. AY1F1 TaxID=2080583 RepID=UPI000CE7CE57|nr:hypothetical protein [Pseudoclavibacter sp. AY1F1]PPF42357.1 hypothetical protein C5B85_16460 [Pseudoclavibacter sp. AY1F1]
MRISAPSRDALRIEAVIDIPLVGLPHIQKLVDRSLARDLQHIYGDVGDDSLLSSDSLSYPQMVSAAADALQRDGLLEQVRFVVLAIATPDSQHQRLLGGYANQRFPSRPDVFAVAEQGAAGPFTAIALAGVRLESTQDRAVVLVLEQTALPPGRTPRPSRDSAVAVVLRRSGPGCIIGSLSVERRSASDTSAPTTSGGGGERPVERASAATTISGCSVPGVGGLRPAHDSVATGVFARLASVWEEAASREPIEVVEHDQVLGYACRLTLDQTLTAGLALAQPQEAASV